MRQDHLNSDSPPKQEVQQLRQALRTIWKQNKSKEDKIISLTEKIESKDLHQKTEQALTIKILKRQLTTIASDLSFSGRKYEALLEKWDRSQTEIKNILKRYKITQAIAVTFFLGTSLFIWQYYRSNASIRLKENKITRLELSNLDQLEQIGRLGKENKTIASKSKVQYESQIKALMQKNNDHSVKQDTLEKNVSLSQTDFKRSINELKHEHQFKLNLIRNEYNNTVELLTAQVSVANDHIQRLEIMSRDVILISETPKETTTVQDKNIPFLKSLKAPEKDLTQQQELAKKSLDDYLKQNRPAFITGESFLPPTQDQIDANIREKF